MRAKSPAIATVGGLFALGGGFLVGLTGADLLDRWQAGINPTSSTAPTLPQGVTSIGQYNDYAVAAKPGLARVGFQLALGVVGLLGGMFAPWSALKLFSYGVGLGAIGHVGLQLVNAYVFEPLFANTNAGAYMYGHEATANAAINPPTTTSSTTTAGAGSQGSAGAPPREAEQAPHRSRYQTPVAAMMPAAPSTTSRVQIPPAMAMASAQPGSMGQAATIAPTPAMTAGNGNGGGTTTPPAQQPPPSPSCPMPPVQMNGGGGNAMGSPPAEPSNVRRIHPMLAAKSQRPASFTSRVA